MRKCIRARRRSLFTLRAVRKAAYRVHITPFALELNGTMQDLELIGKERSDIIDQVPAEADKLVIYEHMGA